MREAAGIGVAAAERAAQAYAWRRTSRAFIGNHGDRLLRGQIGGSRAGQPIREVRPPASRLLAAHYVHPAQGDFVATWPLRLTPIFTQRIGPQSEVRRNWY